MRACWHGGPPHQNKATHRQPGCREGAGIIFGHLNGGSLDSVIQTFDGEICRYEEIPEHCIQTVNTWWPVISKIIFSDAAARKVCTVLSEGACEAQKYVVLPFKFEIFEIQISMIIPYQKFEGFLP